MLISRTEPEELDVRRWELVADGSEKFWEIGRDGASVTVRYGRLGSLGQTKVKDFASDAVAVAHVDRLVAEKVKKGYAEVGGPAAAVELAPAVAAGESTVDAVPPAGDSAVERPDETTFVVPPSWRGAVRPGRGQGARRPVKSTRDVDKYLKAKLGRPPRRLTAVMGHPDSDPELVAAARAYLNGSETPLGAATVAAAMTDEASRFYGREDVATLADAWVVRHGFAFAAAATGDLGRIDISWSGARGREAAMVEWRTVERRRWPYANRQVVERLRVLLIGASEADYLAAVEALSGRRGTLLARTIAAFLAPTRHDWADELFAEVMAEPRLIEEHRLFLTSLRTVEQVAAVAARDGYRGWIVEKDVLPTLVNAVGAGIAPVVAGLLDDDHGDDTRKLLVEALAWLPTDEAFGLLLDRLDDRFVRPAVLGAIKRYPARALRGLAAMTGSESAKALLVGHVKADPALVAEVLPELDDARRAAVEEAASEEGPVPDVPADLLPPLLVTPPWTVKRAVVKPVVVEGLVSPVSRDIRWEPGEREVWAEAFGDNHWPEPKVLVWRLAVDQLFKGKIQWYQQPALVMKAPVDLIRHRLGEWEPEVWSAMDWARPVVARFGIDAFPVALKVAKADPSAGAEVLLPFVDREVAELMADWLVRLKSVYPVAVAWFLRHPETAARALLPAALGKAGKARRDAEAALVLIAGRGHADVLRKVAAEHGERVVGAVEDLIATDPLDRLPAKMPVIGDWADPVLLPRILVRDRRHALPGAAAGHVLTMLAMSKPDDVYAGVDVVRELCDPGSLARFAWAVFEAWRADGTPPKDGWVLPAQGLLGDDGTVRALTPVIRAWPGEGGHSKAVVGLGVLAAIGSDVALLHLNTIAQKAQFSGLKSRARQMINAVAAKLGLTGEQLADRLVPDFGLDDAATLVVDYGPRKFVVGFDEQLKPYVVDGDGKRRKDLPKPGAKDDQELAPSEHKRFAALKKDVRTVAADQIRRFEAAMVARRRWSAEEFRTLFAGHPLLWHVVRRLVWITQDGVGFRLAEDRTLADVDDDAVVLAEDAVVGLAHPLDLGDALDAWAEVFADYEILQPFPQLGRPVHAFTDAERAAKTLTRFEGVEVPVGKLLGLTNRGWRRGEPQDAGVECWITRPVPGGTLVVNLDPGIAVGVVTMFEEQRLTNVWLNDRGGDWRPRGSRTFGELDPITASEVLADLSSLTS
ncbi:DUF4132 domain-containing protein [Umezawaea sp. Da 62-37]|uniref:WGR and DUF4132 domain-containing protein n=1 Tax=Umezawaea sp. Da 62-37 TaxID=3075927 RepID=UPI0028F72308|nr:DUF4132 domain-containing protein [Umezawaea sp. Da 62-37]WNV84677.1 DUF4132 domain-containing protein [Umezawaea sp. Da 62-37]